MKPAVEYSLYLVTDSGLMSSSTVEESVALALEGGCTLVQLREKDKNSRDFFVVAQKVHELCRRHAVPLIINDRLDIALAVDAEGLHLGQKDLPAPVARKILGKDKILGVSAANLEEALQACRDGADYLGVGAMFPTETKTDARPVSPAELEKIRKACSLPIVLIGGMNARTIPQFSGYGVEGFAVVSAIVAQMDIRAATRELKRIALQGLNRTPAQ